MKTLEKITRILIVAGALNWLVVPFKTNLVGKLAGVATWLPNAVYIAVGLAGIKEAYDLYKNWKRN